jgi:DMSO/TMAO reductase YedYZ molybdopterin-dependent catalytic subunit
VRFTAKKLGAGIFLVLVVMNAVVLCAQTVAVPVVNVEGEVLKSLKLSVSDIANLKQTEVPAKDHGGQSRTFKGVALVDVLSAAGVTLGSQLRGKNLLKYVVVRAADSYEVVFSLPEIDPEFTSQTILLAYKVDGEDLAKGDGPFRMVVPNDRKHARWVREVISIKVVSANK